MWSMHVNSRRRLGNTIRVLRMAKGASGREPTCSLLSFNYKLRLSCDLSCSSLSAGKRNASESQPPREFTLGAIQLRAITCVPK